MCSVNLDRCGYERDISSKPTVSLVLDREYDLIPPILRGRSRNKSQERRNQESGLGV